MKLMSIIQLSIFFISFSAILIGQDLSKEELIKKRHRETVEDIPVAYQSPTMNIPNISFDLKEIFIPQLELGSKFPDKYELPFGIGLPEQEAALGPIVEPIIDIPPVPTIEELKSTALSELTVLVDSGLIAESFDRIIALNNFDLTDTEIEAFSDQIDTLVQGNADVELAALYYHTGIRSNHDEFASILISKAEESVNALFESGSRDGELYLIRGEIRFDKVDPRRALIDYRIAKARGVDDVILTQDLRHKLAAAMYRYGGSDAFDVNEERDYLQTAELYIELKPDLKDIDRSVEIDEKFAVMVYRRALLSIENDDRDEALNDVVLVNDLVWNADALINEERITLMKFMHEENVVDVSPVLLEWTNASSPITNQKQMYYDQSSAGHALHYGVWGEWTEQDSVDPSIEHPRHFYVGHRTMSEDIPTVGSAEYEGDVYGHYSSDQMSYEKVTGKSRISISFASREVTGSLELDKNGARWVDATFDASLNPNEKYHYETALNSEDIESGFVKGVLLGTTGQETAFDFGVQTSDGSASGMSIASQV